MAHAIDLDPNTQKAILRQIAESLPVGLEPVAASIALGGTFEVWTLSKLPSGSNEMEKTATQTDSYHHQLFAKGEPVGFVRSRPSENGQTREVTRVVKSSLAKRIEEAMVSSDPLVPGGDIPRLVTAPQYHLFAFWFVISKRCYVISCPATFEFLRSDELLDGSEFLRQVRKEKPVAGATRVEQKS